MTATATIKQTRGKEKGLGEKRNVVAREEAFDRERGARTSGTLIWEVVLRTNVTGRFIHDRQGKGGRGEGDRVTGQS